MNQDWMTILKRQWDAVFPTEGGKISCFVKTEDT